MSNDLRQDGSGNLINPNGDVVMTKTQLDRLNAINQALATTSAASFLSLTLTTYLSATTYISNTGKVINGGITSSSGPGAVSLLGSTHKITTTGTGDALTLADGTIGQEIDIVYVAEGAGADTAVLTPANFLNGTTITFNNLYNAVTLKFDGTNWYVKSLYGAVVA